MRNIALNMKLDLLQHLYFTRIEYGALLPVFSTINAKDVEWFRDKKVPVLILTGIANPRPLRKYARSISTTLKEISFRDHHKYSKKDLDTITRRFRSTGDPDTLILTTEKDAQRLQDLEPEEDIKNALYYVTIHVKFLNEDQEEFNNLILDYVRSNKRDNILHQATN